jgi:hypothetical protein
VRPDSRAAPQRFGLRQRTLCLYLLFGFCLSAFAMPCFHPNATHQSLIANAHQGRRYSVIIRGPIVPLNIKKVSGFD